MARCWERLKAIPSLLRPDAVYLFFSDLSFQAVRDGFRTAQIVQREVDWELEIVDRFRPDVLIGDAWLLTSVVGRLAGLPVVQIIRSAAHPACPQLVWWRDVPEQICSPDVAPVFNVALEEWGLPPIRRAEDLLDGDLLLIPSIPELDPLPRGVERSRYVGPLTRLGRGGEHVPDWLEALPRDRPVIYVTVGGGSDSVRGLRLLPFWEAAFAGTGWTVVVSTGGRPVPRRWQREGNIRVFPWVPGPSMIARADVVLFHGGYGTMMEAVQTGTPGVVLPFHTEQESNGRRLEQNGAALVLAPADEDLRMMEGRWNDERFTYLASHRLKLQPRQVREAVAEILSNKECRASAMRLRRRQVSFGGAALALESLMTLSIL